MLKRGLWSKWTIGFTLMWGYLNAVQYIVINWVRFHWQLGRYPGNSDHTQAIRIKPSEQHSLDMTKSPIQKCISVIYTISLMFNNIGPSFQRKHSASIWWWSINWIEFPRQYILIQRINCKTNKSVNRSLKNEIQKILACLFSSNS